MTDAPPPMEGQVLDSAGRAAAAAADGAALRPVVDVLPLAYQSLDAEGRLRLVNRRWLEQLGYARDEVLGRPFADVLADGEAGRFAARFPRFVELGRVRGVPFRLRRRDGTVLEAEFDGDIERDGSGGFRATHCVFRDRAERDTAERRAAETTATLETILRAAPIGIGLVRDRILGWSNERLQAMIGYAAAELEGQSARMLYASDEEFRRVGEVKHPAVERLGVGSVETRLRRKDGAEVDVLLSSAALHPDDLSAGLIYAVVDVTERVRAERRLTILNRVATVFLSAPDERLYDEILAVVQDVLASPFGVFGYLDEDGTFVAPTLTRTVWDRCQVPEKGWRFPRSAWAGIWGRALEERRTKIANGGLVVPAGHVPIETALAVPLVDHDQAVGLLLVANRPGGYGPEEARLLEAVAGMVAPVLRARLDARRQAERRARLEGQLQRTRRMEALGLLAGGIAHDFNNLLQAIGGNAELLADEVEAGHPFQGPLEEIRAAARRAGGLTQQLLAFGRREPAQPRAVSVTTAARDTVRMLRRVIGAHIEVALELPPTLPAALVDPSQFEQVLLNLCINARDAMPAGGVLRIRAEALPGLDPAHRGIADRLPGDYVAVEVADTGPGIAAEIRERIFEPFFTTKQPGEGSGLGLATVYGIVEQHGGWVELESEPGRGATFRVVLPVAAPAESADAPGPAQDRPAGGRETVLVAEDDETVRRLAVRVLERAGYRVLVARDGAEALSLLETHSGTIDLLLADVIMPGASGLVVAETLRAARPEAAIVFQTGYGGASFDEVLPRLPGSLVLQKPFSTRELLARVREALGAPAAAPG